MRRMRSETGGNAYEITLRSEGAGGAVVATARPEANADRDNGAALPRRACARRVQEVRLMS